MGVFDELALLFVRVGFDSCYCYWFFYIYYIISGAIGKADVLKFFKNDYANQLKNLAMNGGIPYTDDTFMALQLAKSLIDMGQFDEVDIARK